MKKRFFMTVLYTVLGFTTICVAQTDTESEQPLAECPLEMDNKFWPGVLIPRATISGAESGWRIYMDYELITDVNTHMFALTSNFGKTNLPGFSGTIQDNPKDAPDRYCMELTANGSYTYTITDETIAKLKDSSFHGWDGNVRLVGTGFHITKLVLIKEAAEESGFDNIFATDNREDYPIEYFNLQGIKIDIPSPGNIYICRQGPKISKVIVK